MRASFLLPLGLLACAATHEDAPASAADPNLPAAATPGSAAPPPPAATPAPPAAPDCSIDALAAPPAVTPRFVVEQPPAVVHPAMSGGALDGSYVVDRATVFLPSASAGLVDLEASKGRIASWAVFRNGRYRLSLDADFSIATSFGPQAQHVVSTSQGGFTANGPALLLDHACDAALTDEADYSFTDVGSGRATLLVKTPTPYGDVYLQLDATKN